MPWEYCPWSSEQPRKLQARSLLRPQTIFPGTDIKNSYYSISSHCKKVCTANAAFTWLRSTWQLANVFQYNPSSREIVAFFVNIGKREKQKPLQRNPLQQSYCDEVIPRKPLQQSHCKEGITKGIVFSYL